MDEALKKDMRFTWQEFSGSLGDLGLFIPLIVAMTVAADLNIGVVLVMAGLMNIATGLIFKLPLPVQPMKAMAAVVIAESMLKDELVAAGIMLGVILLLMTWGIDWINRCIPRAVVRGIQLGIGLKLIVKAFEWLGELSFFGWDSWIIALVVAFVLFVMQIYNKPGLVVIFGVGFLLLLMDKPTAYSQLSMQWPNFQWHVPDAWAFKHGFYKGVLPQLPLTLLNSVVAVCALSESYFPGKGITPRRMTMSVGLMNLVTVPFGGIPMCHGAGGLAAQYRFGARTGGSVVMLGALKVFVGLFFGHALFQLLQAYPLGILGVMLIFAGGELCWTTRGMWRKKRSAVVMFLTAAVILFQNTFIGFLSGLVAAAAVYLVAGKEDNDG